MDNRNRKENDRPRKTRRKSYLMDTSDNRTLYGGRINKKTSRKSINYTHVVYPQKRRNYAIYSDACIPPPDVVADLYFHEIQKGNQHERAWTYLEPHVGKCTRDQWDSRVKLVAGCGSWQASRLTTTMTDTMRSTRNENDGLSRWIHGDEDGY